MPRRRGLSALLGSLLLVALGLPSVVAHASAAGAAVGTATVTGPITGGNGAVTVQPPPAPLAQVGYEESEYFLSGTASSYTSSAPLGTNGKWSVTAATNAPYTTRAVVRRPIDPKKFNGTVIVEWLNVSGGVDADPDWTMAHNDFVREGFVWVGVSAQQIGVDATKTSDPVRYASLSHPGDSYSYDIFSQAGAAIRADSFLMLNGLKPRRVLAVGESQSAARLLTYIDAVQPLAQVYDGLLVHSRAGSGAPLSQPPQATVAAPATLMVRKDLSAPVFVFETETDVLFSNLADRQADTDHFRLWEVAGTSHYDTYGLLIGPNDNGDGQGAIQNLEAMQNPTNAPPPAGLFDCDSGINTGGAHWLLDSAFHWLNRWVATGTAPPTAPRLRIVSSSPVVLAKDAQGNVRGGVRSPQVDAPVATLSGAGNGGSGSLGQFCSLFGSTVPFSATQLHSLYKNHAAFVTQWDQSVQRDIAGGFLLGPDAAELRVSARLSRVGD